MKKQKPSAPAPPKFYAYHQSIRDELDSMKSRLRQLVEHWPTDGASKETILRNVLRRHLPESLGIGRGFIVNEDEASSEIDILVVDRNKPCLLKEDELVIVTPDAVKAMIEVKTGLATATQIKKAVDRIGRNKRICVEFPGYCRPWAGLFVYEGLYRRSEDLLRIVCQSQRAIDCVVYGPDTVVSVLRDGEGNKCSDDNENPIWVAHEMRKLAHAYFLGAILEAANVLPLDCGRRVWFPEEASRPMRSMLFDPRTMKGHPITVQRVYPTHN